MSFVNVNLMGGLGNCLFQIATAYATSLRDNKTFLCDKNSPQVIHGSLDQYLTNIFKNVNFQESIPNSLIHKEPYFHYSEIPKTLGGIKLHGYFQSEKYFQDYRNEILELFAIDENTKNKLSSKYGNLLGKKTCSLHVRRGDYVRLSQYHTVQSIDYYENSVKIIGEDYNYLIFSDDINWCQENFKFIKNKHFITDNTNYEDLYLMSMCDHNIMANSSFSWWGSWMNKNENKKVIAPKNWFGEKNKHLNTKDIYTNNCVVI